MSIGWKPFTVKVSLVTVLVALVVLLATGAGGIVAWEHQNSNAFCTYTCHAVHPEEPRAHAQGFHARVQCVECHEGRKPTLHILAAKFVHVNRIWAMMAGSYGRPRQAAALRPLRESCEGCHWPSVVHDDSVRVRARYAIDEASTETRYKLTLHTGFGTVRENNAQGIHWHIKQQVNYVALDPQNQQIALVEVIDDDGKKTTYFDASLGVSRADLEKKAKSRMECVDCHSSVGHQFRNPADLVDEAIASGEIDRALPFAKARALALIGKADQLRGSAKELEPKLEKLVEEAVPKSVRASDELENKFATAMNRILLTSSFSKEGFNWRSFPFNTGHKDFPGCFRCHDGKHVDDKGEAIRFQCTLCHDLPKVVGEDGVRSVASTIDPEEIKPRSHRNGNWMRDHAIKPRDSCANCHGEIKVGKDGGSFCSNPACHGREWPAIVIAQMPVGAAALQGESPPAQPAPAPATKPVSPPARKP